MTDDRPLPPMNGARIDHLVVSAATLAEGTAWVESLLGVPLQPGGQHPSMGTHNALLRLGEDIYLEVIAIDPAAPAPDQPRWFGLDTRRPRSGPRLATWVARASDIEDVAARATWLAPPMAMTRGEHRWRIAFAADGSLPGDGLLPALIDWTTPPPAAGLADRGCELVRLAGTSADPGAVRTALASLVLDPYAPLALDPDAPLALDLSMPTLGVAPPGEPAQLVATIATPGGLRVLGDHDVVTRATTTGIVLAGGRSSRYGSDKLRATLDGRPLAHHAIEALATCSTEVLVAVADAATAPPLPDGLPMPVRLVMDPVPDVGPLAGLVAGLTSATTEFVLVAGGDQPTLMPDLLRLLTGSIRGGDAAALADRDRPRPLPAVLRRVPALAAATARLATEQRSLRALVFDLDPIVVPGRTWRRVDPDGAWRRDVDRPEDLPPGN